MKKFWITVAAAIGVVVLVVGGCTMWLIESMAV